MITKMKEVLQTFTAHAFEAHWQQQQFQKAKKMLKPGDVLEILDFAENYRTAYQNEPQSIHWQYEQVTVHPIVTFYK